MDQILNKDPTELSYTERIFFRKDVNTNSSWTFELGNAGGSSGIESPTFVIVGFKLEIKLILRFMIMQCLTGCQIVMLFVK